MAFEDVDAATGAARTRVTFVLRLAGERVELASEVPIGPSRLRDVLPAIHDLADAVVGTAVSRALEPAADSTAPRQVSCRAGCGACCRQPVPIARAEAAMLRDLVAALPEDARRRIEARFASAVAELAEHGLLDSLRSLDAIESVEARQVLAGEYFALNIPCPFLEDESCGIHPVRPLACREYLVTSPAQRCARPNPEEIDLVPMPVRPSVALFRFASARDEGEPTSLVMILALEHCARVPEEDEVRRPGTELFERFVRGLAGEKPAP